jgi:hypothetical protein
MDIFLLVFNKLNSVLKKKQRNTYIPVKVLMYIFIQKNKFPKNSSASFIFFIYFKLVESILSFSSNGYALIFKIKM